MPTFRINYKTKGKTLLQKSETIFLRDEKQENIYINKTTTHRLPRNSLSLSALEILHFWFTLTIIFDYLSFFFLSSVGWVSPGVVDWKNTSSRASLDIVLRQKTPEFDFLWFSLPRKCVNHFVSTIHSKVQQATTRLRLSRSFSLSQAD